MPTVSKAARVRDALWALVPARSAVVVATWCPSCARWLGPRCFDPDANVCRSCLGRGWR